MNIEHKLEPIEHWIVDGKAYRLATEKDVGKEVYFDDTGIVMAFSDPHYRELTRVTKSGSEFRFYSHAGWRYAYIQDDSLLTPQRTPVPALGEGWYLLNRNEQIQKGDMFDATCLDGGWVDAGSSVGSTLEAYPNRCRAARYFGPTEDTEIKPGPSKEPTKTIDWTKPVRTKDGRAVRVLCTDGPGEYPVIGIIDGEPNPDTWTLAGDAVVGDLDSAFDLENAPSRIQREYWVNVYEGVETLLWYRTKKNADESASTARIACVKITIDCEEGEGL